MYIRNPFRRHQGYHVPHQSRYEWGGCPLYPGAIGVPAHPYDGDVPFAGTVVPVTTTRYHRISPSGDLRSRGLIRGSLAFTRPFFPLPGFSVWLRDSLGFTPCFTPCRCQQRMPESGIGFGHLPKPFGYSTEAASCRTTVLSVHVPDASASSANSAD